MKCYCLEILRAKYGDQVDGKCLRESCARWRREQCVYEGEQVTVVYKRKADYSQDPFAKREPSPYIQELFERSDRAIKELKRKE